MGVDARKRDFYPPVGKSLPLISTFALYACQMGGQARTVKYIGAWHPDYRYIHTYKDRKLPLGLAQLKKSTPTGCITIMVDLPARMADKLY